MLNFLYGKFTHETTIHNIEKVETLENVILWVLKGEGVTRTSYFDSEILSFKKRLEDETPLTSNMEMQGLSFNLNADISPQDFPENQNFQDFQNLRLACLSYITYESESKGVLRVTNLNLYNKKVEDRVKLISNNNLRKQLLEFVTSLTVQTDFYQPFITLLLFNFRTKNLPHSFANLETIVASLRSENTDSCLRSFYISCSKEYNYFTTHSLKSTFSVPNFDDNLHNQIPNFVLETKFEDSTINKGTIAFNTNHPILNQEIESTYAESKTLYENLKKKFLFIYVAMQEELKKIKAISEIQDPEEQEKEVKRKLEKYCFIEDKKNVVTDEFEFDVDKITFFVKGFRNLFSIRTEWKKNMQCGLLVKRNNTLLPVEEILTYYPCNPKNKKTPVLPISPPNLDDPFCMDETRPENMKLLREKKVFIENLTCKG